MILETYGAVLNEIAFPLWKETPDIIELIAKIIGGLTAISLFFKKARQKIYRPLYQIIHYFYINIPFMKRIAWLEQQMVHKNDVLDQLLAGQNIIKGELTQNGSKSLKDSVMNIEKTVAKIRTGQKIIYDSVPYGIAEFDENGFLLIANDVIIQWSGITIQELTGKGYLNMFYADDRDFVNKQMMAAIFDLRTCDIEARLQDRSKVRIMAKPVSPNGKLLGYTAKIEKL